jgi:hypothetical protein
LDLLFRFEILDILIFKKFKILFLQDALKDEFYEYSLVYKLVYMSLIFFLFRNRFYIAWILAEFSAITSGKLIQMLRTANPMLYYLWF